MAIGKFSFAAIIYLLCLTGCSSIQNHGTLEDMEVGQYGTITYNANFGEWQLREDVNPTMGVFMDFILDPIMQPIAVVVDFITFRFIWGSGGPANYGLQIVSLFPGYTHIDAARTKDWQKLLDMQPSHHPELEPTPKSEIYNWKPGPELEGQPETPK